MHRLGDYGIEDMHIVGAYEIETEQNRLWDLKCAQNRILEDWGHGQNMRLCTE